ncbi:hypothetical protein BJ742DRAFT_55075 [Cladochytrium replicatum]|nr:hypothetical protein BJ742DRAFT_55075 [Cladochytrium replicatum]
MSYISRATEVRWPPVPTAQSEQRPLSWADVARTKSSESQILKTSTFINQVFDNQRVGKESDLKTKCGGVISISIAPATSTATSNQSVDSNSGTTTIQKQIFRHSVDAVADTTPQNSTPSSAIESDRASSSSDTLAMESTSQRSTAAVKPQRYSREELLAIGKNSQFSLTNSDIVRIHEITNHGHGWNPERNGLDNKSKHTYAQSETLTGHTTARSSANKEDASLQTPDNTNDGNSAASSTVNADKPQIEVIDLTLDDSPVAEERSVPVANRGGQPNGLQPVFGESSTPRTEVRSFPSSNSSAAPFRLDFGPPSAWELEKRRPLHAWSKSSSSSSKPSSFHMDGRPSKLARLSDGTASAREPDRGVDLDPSFVRYLEIIEANKGPRKFDSAGNAISLDHNAQEALVNVVCTILRDLVRWYILDRLPYVPLQLRPIDRSASSWDFSLIVSILRQINGDQFYRPIEGIRKPLHTLLSRMKDLRNIKSHVSSTRGELNETDDILMADIGSLSNIVWILADVVIDGRFRQPYTKKTSMICASFHKGIINVISLEVNDPNAIINAMRALDELPTHDSERATTASSSLQPGRLKPPIPNAVKELLVCGLVNGDARILRIAQAVIKGDARMVERCVRAVHYGMSTFEQQTGQSEHASVAAKQKWLLECVATLRSGLLL